MLFSLRTALPAGIGRYCFLAVLIAPVPCGTLARAGEDKAKLAGQAQAFLQKYCARCHGPEGTNEANINYILDRDKLVEKNRIVPGDPDKSRIVKILRKDSMPPEEEKVRPAKEEVAAFEAWVKSGAPTFPTVVVKEKARPYRTHRDTLTAIRDHLQNKVKEQDRKYQRYFSFLPQHNDTRLNDAGMRTYQAALSKLVNSLSWKIGIVLPEPIDADQTVFAVDLRKVGWDRYQLWGEILAEYPYGLKFDRVDDEDVQELAKQVTTFAGVEVPVVRADWFIATASRPELYYRMLRLPTTGYELEKLLKVNATDNFMQDQLVRAGFSSSGVSGQNRMIERHETPYGAYWKSYDFKSNQGNGSLFKKPLGPMFKGHPYPDLAFEQDGGEMIFHLPNGMQAYYLVDGKDKRINKGPIEVVSDPAKFSGSNEIVNGLSCIACHKHGMIKEFKDTVRTGSALDGDPLIKLKRLYAKPADLDKLMQEDQDRFLAAVEKSIGPILRVGADREKKIEDLTASEPVGMTGRKYLLHEITIEVAVLELGLPLTDVVKVKATIEANKRLRELGLLPLARDASIKREVWESREHLVSPYQEVANILGIGVPMNYRRPSP